MVSLNITDSNVPNLTFSPKDFLFAGTVAVAITAAVWICGNRLIRWFSSENPNVSQQNSKTLQPQKIPVRNVVRPRYQESEETTKCRRLSGEIVKLISTFFERQNLIEINLEITSDLLNQISKLKIEKDAIFLSNYIQLLDNINELMSKLFYQKDSVPKSHETTFRLTYRIWAQYFRIMNDAIKTSGLANKEPLLTRIEEIYNIFLLKEANNNHSKVNAG